MAELNFENLNLLVVEDEKISQRVLLKVLDNLGVGSVEVSENGAEALE